MRVTGRGAGAAMRSGEDTQSRKLDPGEAVTALFREHAVGLTRLAVAMLGNRPAAEDVVQEAFCGLYRRWSHLSDPAKSLPYVRSAVLNGCRSVIRRRSRQNGRATTEPAAASAEYDALVGEEHRAVLQAVRALPRRQREALMLRYFADLDPPGSLRLGPPSSSRWWRRLGTTARSFWARSLFTSGRRPVPRPRPGLRAARGPGCCPPCPRCSTCCASTLRGVRHI